MSPTQAEKGEAFRALHTAPDAFVIANAWDGGSARILQALGFKAIATSSGAQAATYGRVDGRVSRDEALAHCRIIATATDLPVSGDLEKGFADDPQDLPETIRLAAEAGLVGCSIEDATGDRANPIFERSLAIDRVAASVEAARKLPFAFTLTARTENFVRGRNDLEDTIARLQAFEAAGADVLMAPGLPDLDSVRAVCSSVSKPVNFMAGIPGRSFSVAELAAAGVKRISLATSLHRAAMTGLLAAAREVAEHGTFSYVETSVPGAELAAYMLR
jgi:2-methylisocitrate lyase-like PEP mutase family enzyme